VDDVVFRCECWGMERWVSEAYCVGDGDGLGVLLQQCEASIMLERWANVVGVSAAVVPRALGGWFGMRDNPASWGAHWSGVEIETSM
jgi:hypothetical protein